MEEISVKDKKFCECGCGELIPKINKKYKSAKYKHGHNPQKNGILSTSWKGGRSHRNEYILIKNNDHPFASNNGYVLEHRCVMEQHLGRYLDPSEIVHHINGDKKDNRIENLQLLTPSEHTTHHKIWSYERIPGKPRKPYRKRK